MDINNKKKQKMSLDSHISLIDLNNQFPFEIDDATKQAICFAETLIVSCGHYEGDNGEESGSEWSCQSTEENEQTVPQQKEEVRNEIKNVVKEESIVEEEAPDDDNDFHFYFFPDCSKPLPPINSKASVLVRPDGFPYVNQAPQGIQFCNCAVDKKTGKCTCFIALPCKCGAKVALACTCAKSEAVCICHQNDPAPVCTCKESDVCVCHPDNKPRPICTCDKVDRPCLCHPGKFPTPICTCKHKPKFERVTDAAIPEEGCEDYEFGEMAETIETESSRTPCECTKPEPKSHCEIPCECLAVENEEEPCQNKETDSKCSCTPAAECKCGAESRFDCKCFPKPGLCTCGNPDKCVCYAVCECVQPCICDTVPQDAKPPQCVCLNKQGELECTCHSKLDGGLKLKKTRAGKHGYRWCHDVDPRHTYFDYAYGKHHKITQKEQMKEKFKILGLYVEKEESDVCAVHGVKVSPYQKKVRKPSLDCCSTVGGITISVETLGEDKDKFLVQVVSHTSKEGAKAGTKLVSILDCNLHTMEENRTENITKKDLTKERRSYMAICENGYYNKVTRVCGERDVVKRFYHTFADSREFLLEGANVVLIRYFGISRYRGTIRTETVLMDGVICESIYVCLGVSQAIVNGKPLFVCKIERHIIEPSGVLHQTLTVVTLRGYIVSHEWADNSYIIHLNPLLNVIPEKDIIEPHVPLRQNWREDLQLLSDYLDFKSTRTSEGGRYVSESGTLTNTVRDYLQALLLLRPQDALHFTRHYFGVALSALDLPHDEYFDPCNRHVRYYFFED